MNSTTLSTLSIATVNRDRENSVQHDPDTRRVDSADEFATAQDFSSVLDSARMVFGNTNRISGFNAASPTQMFESLSPNKHDHRQSVMQQQYRSDSLNGPGSRLDPTNVQARLSNQPTIEPDQKAQNQRIDISDLKLNSQNASTPVNRQSQAEDIIRTNPSTEMKNTREALGFRERAVITVSKELVGFL